MFKTLSSECLGQPCPMCLFQCLCMRKKFNLGRKFQTSRERAFIFRMCIPCDNTSNGTILHECIACDKTFHMVPYVMYVCRPRSKPYMVNGASLEGIICFTL